MKNKNSWVRANNEMKISTFVKYTNKIYELNYQNKFADFVLDSMYEPHFSPKDVIGRMEGYLDGAIVTDELDVAIEKNFIEFFKLYKITL